MLWNFHFNWILNIFSTSAVLSKWSRNEIMKAIPLWLSIFIIKERDTVIKPLKTEVSTK